MQKQTIVFIPGLGYTKQLWDKLIQSLPKNKYSCHAIDIDPYGTYYNSVPLNFETYPNYLKDQLKKINIKPPFILVGHSLGGYISLEYTIRFPKKVEKLIIISVPLRNPKSGSPLSYKFLIWLGVNFYFVDRVIKKILNSNHQYLKTVIKNLIPMDPGFLKNSDAKSVALCCKDLLAHNWPEETQSIINKTLIAYGTKDQAIIRTHGTELYKHFQNAKIISFACNHSIPVKYPKRLAREILEFIEYG